ncbi:MAG: amidohydrolase family protein [Bacteroidia bacterium]|nr:amidohydrolase family protein [Bacteroidia bacterium]
MTQGGKTKKGCLRPLLIGIITVTSLSFAIFYSIFLRGRYNGKKLPYKAYVFQNVNTWSGVDEIQEGVTVVMEGELITCVGKDCKTPEGAKVIDAKGKSLIPGLIDMQVGFYALSAENQDKSPIETLVDYPRQRPDVRKHLHEAGITTIRSAGDPMNNIRLLKKQIQDWEMAGPRVFAVGPIFTAKGGHPASTTLKEDPNLIEVYATQVSDSNIARREVISTLDAGMDGIKIVLDNFGGAASTLNPDLAASIVNQAKRRNVWVSARTGSNESLQLALQLGVDIIEYMPREALDSLSLQLLKERDPLLVPILISSEIIPDGVEASYFENPFAKANARLLSEEGYSLTTGTATGRDVSFGASLHSEMEIMVQAGLNPQQVLKAATINPLFLFRMDGQYGKIEKGYTAEGVLIDGKPWENIKDIRKVEIVIQDGRMVVEDGKVLD